MCKAQTVAEIANWAVAPFNNCRVGNAAVTPIARRRRLLRKQSSIKGLAQSKVSTNDCRKMLEVAHVAQSKRAASYAFKRSSSSESLISSSSGRSGRRAPLKRCSSSSESDECSKRLRRVLSFDDSIVQPRAAEDDQTHVEAALASHANVLRTFLETQKLSGWKDACAEAESASAAMYEELVVFFNHMLSASELPEPSVHSLGDRSDAYSVVTLQGQSVQGSTSRPAVSVSQKLERLRELGCKHRSREALVAVAACMASRREMCWVDDYCGEKPGRGYFAHSLADAGSSIRIAYFHDEKALCRRPAALLLCSRTTLREALDNMDSSGPLKELPRHDGRVYELGFQELLDIDTLGTSSNVPEERTPVKSVGTDKALSRLLNSSEKVIVVDAYVALAPREIATAHGIGKIVKAEFEHVLRTARAEGTTVVLQCGGSNPHLLARKVYMRPEFSRHGLTCGYIRWRAASSKGSWGREQVSVNRCCVAVQISP